MDKVCRETLLRVQSRLDSALSATRQSAEIKFCPACDKEWTDAPQPATARSDEIAAEVERAVAKFPTWPTDPLHALAVLGEEFGELTKAMVQLTYEPHKTSAEEVKIEAIQTVAMALRLHRSLDQYEYRPGAQHKQNAPLSETAPSGTAKESPYDDPLFVAVDAAHDKDERQRMHDQGVREGLHPPVPPKHKPVA
jgi:hypothetical protein